MSVHDETSVADMPCVQCSYLRRKLFEHAGIGAEALERTGWRQILLDSLATEKEEENRDEEELDESRDELEKDVQ